MLSACHQLHLSYSRLTDVANQFYIIHFTDKPWYDHVHVLLVVLLVPFEKMSMGNNTKLYLFSYSINLLMVCFSLRLLSFVAIFMFIGCCLFPLRLRLCDGPHTIGIFLHGKRLPIYILKWTLPRRKQYHRQTKKKKKRRRELTIFPGNVWIILKKNTIKDSNRPLSNYFVMFVCQLNKELDLSGITLASNLKCVCKIWRVEQVCNFETINLL